MKEYLGQARNLTAVYDSEDKCFKRRAEVVILYAEPAFHASLGGGIKSERAIGHERIVMSKDGLMSLSKALAEMAQDLDEMPLPEENK